MEHSSDNDSDGEMGAAYLLKAETWFDVYFLVGENQERIGAIRSNLISQSRTWWSMLSPESPLVENEDIALPDIEPDVFRLLLKYVYGGLDDLFSLPDETVVNLCYCANKYFMTHLMKKISVRLQPSSVDNLFSALHCLVYYNLHDVETSVTKIVQGETRKIFAHPDFLECDVDCIVYIVKQDRLNCGELEVWRSVLLWAESRAESNEGSEVRKWILGPLQHIRLLTLTITDLHREVFACSILKSREIVAICRRDLKDIETLCKKSEIRCSGNNIITVKIKQNVQWASTHYLDSNSSCSCIITNQSTIRLLSLACKGNIHSCTTYKDLFFGYSMAVNITITITRITNHMDNTSDEEPVVIRHNDLKLFFAEMFSIPTVVGDKGVMLLANSKYKIDLQFNDSTTRGIPGFCNLPSWSAPDCVQGHEFAHGKFHCSLIYNNGTGQTPCHIRQFTYTPTI